MKAEAIVLMGPPGVGKGTQGKRIAKEGRIPYVGMSDVVRERSKVDPDFERYAKPLMARRELLPDDVINNLWVDAVRSIRGYTDIVLDGFPRTGAQFELMREHLLAMDIQPVVIFFMARYEVTNERRLARIQEAIARGEAPREDDLDESIHRKGFDTYIREAKQIEGCVRARSTFHHYVNAERPPDQIYSEVVSHFHLPFINMNVGELTAQ
ncbi:MAG TPA: nucleoside monophosphate kinase [Parcubacteria group bacterium]|jgi:adenylate kinase|nr:nucleoside monophosphate kinase [Parcubacteria group bacterium]